MTTTSVGAGLLDARELELFVVAARESDVNLPGGSHDLRNYWVRGPGAAKIRWGTDGSFDRCVAQLSKYVKRPQGLCAEYHKAATGEWPAEKGVPSAGEVVELTEEFSALVASAARFADQSDPNEPYGDVRYADNGLQPDGRKRYPIDTEEHIRAAWSYINMPKNASKYSSDDLAKVKARIKRAMNKIGADVADDSKREEAVVTTTEEFHGTHPQGSHGNWARELGGMKKVTPADVANTVKSLGSGGKPSSTRKLNPKSGSAEYERGIGSRTSNDFEDSDVDEREEDRRNSEMLSTWDDVDSARRSVKPGEIFAYGDDPDGAYKVRLKRVAGEENSVLSEVTFDAGKTWEPAESEDGDGVIDFNDIESDISWHRYSGKLLTAAASSKKNKCPPGQHKMPDGTCMDDEKMDKDMPFPTGEYADEPWEGTLVIEGAESGDGRLFALGSLDWAQLPLPLLYQPANTGGHSGSFTVGEITHAARRGNQVYGWGHVFGTSLGGEHGEGIRNTMKVGGVSVDVDKVKDADVELVFGDDDGEGGNPFAKPETTIFHRGRIRGATLVAFPAFVEAKLRFTGVLAEQAEPTPVTASVKSCGCGDGPNGFDEDGAAELLVASAEDDTSHTITIPNVPPAHWFSEPTDVEVSGALTITDEGRLFAIVAPADVTHRSVKTRVPRNVDFSRFHKAETIVRGGERVVTGVITADCGHAPTQNYGTLDKRREHYDNSCSVLANVRVGQRRDGTIWAAGALNPGATADQVARALGCTLSLDVQPHPDRHGVREFIAAHLVPVPGFPLARTRASATYSDGVLSAAALPVAYVDKPKRVQGNQLALEFVARAKADVAQRLGLDAVSRKRELALTLGLEEFHGTGSQKAHGNRAGDGATSVNRPHVTVEQDDVGDYIVNAQYYGGNIPGKTASRPDGWTVDARKNKKLADQVKKHSDLISDWVRKQNRRYRLKVAFEGDKIILHNYDTDAKLGEISLPSKVS